MHLLNEYCAKSVQLSIERKKRTTYVESSWRGRPYFPNSRLNTQIVPITRLIILAVGRGTSNNQKTLGGSKRIGTKRARASSFNLSFPPRYAPFY